MQTSNFAFSVKAKWWAPIGSARILVCVHCGVSAVPGPKCDRRIAFATWKASNPQNPAPSVRSRRGGMHVVAGADAVAAVSDVCVQRIGHATNGPLCRIDRAWRHVLIKGHRAIKGRPGSGISVMLKDIRAGLADIGRGVSSWRMWSMLAWNDVRRRYRRSGLGQFWLTLSMAATIGGLGYIYSHLLGSTYPPTCPTLP